MALPPEVIAETVKSAKAALGKLDEADKDIRKAKLAGLDVTQHEVDSKSQRARLNQLLAVYGR